MVAAKMLKVGEGQFLLFILKLNLTRNAAIYTDKYLKNIPQQSGPGLCKQTSISKLTLSSSCNPPSKFKEVLTFVLSGAPQYLSQSTYLKHHSFHQ